MNRLKENWFRARTICLVILMFVVSLNFANAFATEYSYDEAGLISGIWHGLLAPYSLIARWFFSDVIMYATSNTGWFYDAGFLLGIVGSIPIGWAGAIVSALGHIFLY